MSARAKRVLVTGAAGFVGSHVSEALLQRGDFVVGLDIKRQNIDEICATAPPDRFVFVEGDVGDADTLSRLFDEHRIDAVFHLAAVPGVRASVDDPRRCWEVNVGGTHGLLEVARRVPGLHFVLASSSSVYGDGAQPFEESACADRPLSPYAASKRSAELLGHAYWNTYGLPFTAVRLFTVYGPRNRPDMLAMQALDRMVRGDEVTLYANGDLQRDWTYVSDATRGLLAALDRPGGHQIFNVGSGRAVGVAEFIRVLERVTRLQARTQDAPRPCTDARITCADLHRARAALGYEPQVTLEEGLASLWRWYQRP